MPLDVQSKQTPRARRPTSPFFFEGVDFRRWLGISLSLGLLSAVLLTASELNVFPQRVFSLSDFLQNFAAYSGSVLMALIFAEKSSLEGFLFRREKSWPAKLGILLSYGGLSGLAMGIAYHRAFAVYRFSPRVPFRMRNMKTWYDSFILSLSAAVTEELVFRLLLFTAFFYVLSRLFRPILSFESKFNRSIPLLFSLVFSSLLFGVVHGVYGFLFAFVAGVALCLIFLRGGLESAILAHFLTNLVFFNLTYLKRP
jgi:membrane protease YdiL (CAAX protease family)